MGVYSIGQAFREKSGKKEKMLKTKRTREGICGERTGIIPA